VAREVLVVTRGRGGARGWARFGGASATRGRSLAQERLLLVAFGVSASFRILVNVVYPYNLGFDARLYTDAARVWLAGGNPWAQPYELGIYYAAPPPSLLVMAPFTLLPSWAAGVLGVLLLAVLALAATRSLGLPAYWVFFVPVLDGILVGSLDVATLAVLVIAGGRLSALAPFLKIYGAIPMLGERRWRQLALSAVLLGVTVPILPWPTYIESLPRITSNLADQSMTTSVWGSIPLMVVFGVGLLSLGLRRAGWLAVPILWPSTQPHYAAISLPAVATSTILAVGYAFSFLMPWAPAVATAMFIVATQYRHLMKSDPPESRDRVERDPVSSDARLAFARRMLHRLQVR
jgi:hypothetical protein